MRSSRLSHTRITEKLIYLGLRHISACALAIGHTGHEFRELETLEPSVLKIWQSGKVSELTKTLRYILVTTFAVQFIKLPTTARTQTFVHNRWADINTTRSSPAHLFFKRVAEGVSVRSVAGVR